MIDIEIVGFYWKKFLIDFVFYICMNIEIERYPFL